MGALAVLEEALSVYPPESWDAAYGSSGTIGAVGDLLAGWGFDGGHNRTMDAQDAPTLAEVNPQKRRTGLNRVWHATGYSLQGLRAGWGETAFRQEATVALVLLPLAFWLGRTWVEVALLAGSILLVMIVELLNTCIETAIDRIGPEWNHLSKRAKDMGSAAVLLSLMLAGGIWSAAVAQRIAA